MHAAGVVAGQLLAAAEVAALGVVAFAVGHYALEILLGHEELFVVVLEVLDWDLEVTGLRSLAVI